MTVDVGGQRVGSRRLPVGGGPAHLRFDLPAGTLNNDLKGRPLRGVGLGLSFDLQAEQRSCVPLGDEAARVTILNSSKITLPHRITSDRDLGRFPAPLAGAGRRPAVVIPDRPTPGELTAGLQVAVVNLNPIGRHLAAEAA